MGRRTPRRAWRPSPTGCMADVEKLSDAGQDRRSSSRRRSPTAPSSCSARCRSPRSPARRSATRTSTSSTSRPTSQGARAAYEIVAPILRKRKSPSSPTRSQRRFDDRRHARSSRTAQGDGFVVLHRRSTTADTRALSQARRRPRRAAVAGARADRRREHGAADATRTAGRPVRRRPPPSAVGAACGSAATTRTAADGAGTGRGPVPRRAPGGDRHRPRRTGCTSRPSTSTADDRADAARLLRTWTGGRRAHDRAAAACRRATTSPLAPPDDTGEALGLAAVAADDHLRLRPDAVRRPLRPARRGARRRCASCPPLPGDELDPERSRRRPVRPGLRRRPAGRLPRRPQPGPARPRGGGHALVAARLRPHLDDQPLQTTPRNLMGFKDGTEQHPRRGHRARWTTHVWVARRRRAGWLRGGTYLVARRIRMLIEIWDRASLQRPGADDRPHTSTPARRSAARASSTGRAGRACRVRRPRAARAPPSQRRRRGSCAAATRSPTGWTRASASSTPGLFFIAFQRDPDAVRARAAPARRHRRAQRVHQARGPASSPSRRACASPAGTSARA